MERGRARREVFGDDYPKGSSTDAREGYLLATLAVSHATINSLRIIKTLGKDGEDVRLTLERDPIGSGLICLGSPSLSMGNRIMPSLGPDRV